MQKIVTCITFIFVIILLGKQLLPGNTMFEFHDETQPARIQEFALNVRQLHIPPRMAPNFSYGMSYPVFNFYAPFSYWITSGLHLAGFDVPDSLKVSILIAILAAGVAMYALLRTYMSWAAALLGASLYIASPWLASEIFVRGNLGEVWFWALFPTALYMVRKNSMSNGFGTTALTAVLLSFALTVHNVLSLLLLPIIIIYAFMHPRRERNYTAIISALLLSTYFLVPAVSELSLTYARDVATKTQFEDHFLCLQQLWTAPFWGYGGSAPGCTNDGMAFMIGKLQIVFGTAGIIFFLYQSFKHHSKKHSKDAHKTTFFILFLTVLSIFLTVEQSHIIWEVLRPLLAVFQFPWRFLFFGVFGLSFFAAYFFGQSTSKYIIWIIPLLVVYSLFSASKYFTRPPIAKQEFEKKYLSESYINNEVAFKIPEYLPKVANYEAWRALEKNPQKPSTVNYVIPLDREPVAVLDRTYWEKTERTMSGRFAINVHYFPFWHIYIDGERVIPEEFDELGRPLFQTEPKMKTITVRYQQSTLELISSITSAMTAVALGLLYITSVSKAKRQRNQ